MDKELFKKTEGRLYRYYKNLFIIEKLKKKAERLYIQARSIKTETKELNCLNIEVYSGMGIDYSKDIVQSTATGIGEAERGTINYISRLEKDYRITVKNMIKTNEKIRNMELELDDMTFNLKMLNDEFKKFAKYKYKDNKTVKWIACEMYNGIESTAYRKREEVVQAIAEWSNMIK